MRFKPDVRVKQAVRGWLGVPLRKGTMLRVLWVSTAKGRPRHCVDRKGRHVAVLPAWIQPL